MQNVKIFEDRPMCCHLDTTHERDRQTDGQTPRPMRSVARQKAKKLSYCCDRRALQLKKFMLFKIFAENYAV